MGARLVVVNFFGSAHTSDLAVSPAAATLYPATNLQNDVSSDTWRSTSLNPQVFTGSFGGNGRRISMWGIYPGRGAASLLGAQARVRYFSDAARVSQVYDSATLDVFTPTGVVWGTFPWGSHPWSVEHGHHHVRRTSIERWFSAVDAGSYEVTLSNGGAVDTSYLEASGIYFGDYVEAPYNALMGCSAGWRTMSQARRSYGATLRRNRREQYRALRVEIVLDSEETRAQWFALCHAADPGTEIIFSLFQDGDGARLVQDFTVRGSLTVLNPLVWESKDFHRLQIEIEES